MTQNCRKLSAEVAQPNVEQFNKKLLHPWVHLKQIVKILNNLSFMYV